MSPRIVHRCHAVDCSVPVPEALLMCPGHWGVVPWPIRARVAAEFRHGQERDKNPSLLWCLAADQAVAHVAALEGRLMGRQPPPAPAWLRRMRFHVVAPIEPCGDGGLWLLPVAMLIAGSWLLAWVSSGGRF